MWEVVVTAELEARLQVQKRRADEMVQLQAEQEFITGNYLGTACSELI